MTNCLLAAPTPTVRTTRRRGRRALPPGVPRWAWLLGVTVVPLTPHDDTEPHAWVVSAGAGTAHTAALMYDDPAHD